ncbi:MAG: IclR family transcriptional regulator [Propionibacterium sp.]|nr:IclR family transcriptional regulator [Propionibacterium sp.]
MFARARASKNRPPYAITSVDNALRLAAHLQIEGRTTVNEAAELLGVAPSTAHRLLAMLVYRDFAVHDGREYQVGPALVPVSQEAGAAPPSRLRTAAMSPMTRLVDAVTETVTLMIRTTRVVRFIAEVECSHTLRVGHRTGMTFPAHRTSGGLSLLAELSDDQLVELYHDASDDERAPDVADLLKHVRATREQGFALNTGFSEQGVVALGHVIRDHEGTAVAALAIAMPELRFEPRAVRDLITALRTTCGEIQRNLDHGAEPR